MVSIKSAATYGVDNFKHITLTQLVLCKLTAGQDFTVNLYRNSAFDLHVLENIRNR